MTVNIDLLGIPCAEYCEHDGIKGVFIPEAPNFRYSPPERLGRGAVPARAMISVGLFKTNKRSQKYDYMGQMNIWPEYQDAYLANPNTVNRKRYMAYGYNWTQRNEQSPARTSDARDFERLLDD